MQQCKYRTGDAATGRDAAGGGQGFTCMQNDVIICICAIGK